MDKRELELYNILLDDGYDEDFAELCVDNMVDEERIIGEIVGYFAEIYNSRMSEVEGVSEGMKNFVSYFVKERLAILSPSFCSDEYMTTGLNLFMESDLEKTAFAINGGTHFVIFDNEEDAPEENRTFHTLSDYLIFHHDAQEKIIKAINAFEWKKEDDAKETETEASSESVKSMDAYNVAIRWLRENRNDENYKKVSLLVGQYHYGFYVHRELEDCLESIGVEFEKR
jgi:hypothetical protein